MDTRPPSKNNPEILQEQEAARLLARASELDVARESGSAVVDLRAAAVEAGISATAFDAALAELQGDRKDPLPHVRKRPRRRSRTRALAAAFALILAGALTIARQQAPAGEATQGGAQIVEETILLRCLSPVEAAELIRPLLSGTNAVVSNPSSAPRLLTVRATPAQLQNVKSVLEKYESAPSATCASPPPATVTP